MCFVYFAEIIAAVKRLIDEGRSFVASIGSECSLPYFAPQNGLLGSVQNPLALPFGL